MNDFFFEKKKLLQCGVLTERKKERKKSVQEPTSGFYFSLQSGGEKERIPETFKSI